MNLSPYELHVLLDVYVGSPIVSVPQATQHFADTLAQLCKRGLIERDDRESTDAPTMAVYLPTEKLKVMMYHMLSTPDPIGAWKIPARTETVGEMARD